MRRSVTGESGRGRLRIALGGFAVFALLATACGGDDDDDDAAPPATEAGATTEAGAETDGRGHGRGHGRRDDGDVGRQ